MQNEPVILETILDAPTGKVWEAITNKDEMKKWYFDLAEFKAAEGFEFQFYGGTEDNKYLHLCKVTEVENGRKLSYSWKYDGYPGESFVTFELFPEGNKTKLKLTHKGLDSFPADNPDLKRENFVLGWNQIIGTSLQNYLDNEATGSA